RWKGKIRERQVCEQVTGFEDWLPTLLELAGVQEKAPAGLDGFSFAPLLFGKKIRSGHFFIASFQAMEASNRCASATGKACAQT
ncbi:MAG: N-acetylgalactosamine-6-sulfatase, partial [Verrucomicrobiota bacterium]